MLGDFSDELGEFLPIACHASSLEEPDVALRLFMVDLVRDQPDNSQGQEQDGQAYIHSGDAERISGCRRRSG